MAQKKKLSIEGKTFRKITLEDMKEYIETKGNADDKKSFIAEAFVANKSGEKQYNHLKAVKWFCGHFEEFNSLIPVAKPKKPTAKETLSDWF